MGATEPMTTQQALTAHSVEGGREGGWEGRKGEREGGREGGREGRREGGRGGEGGREGRKGEREGERLLTTSSPSSFSFSFFGFLGLSKRVTTLSAASHI